MIKCALSLAVVLLTLWPIPSTAEIARVRGGEHWGFTRITVAARDIDSWRFGRDGQTYELQTSDNITGYELHRAFERIGKNRLARLWRDPVRGTLRFALACDCHAFAFNVGRGLIAIDLRDGPAPDGSAFERPLRPASIYAGGLVAPNLWHGSQPPNQHRDYDWLTNEIWRRHLPSPQAAQSPVDPLRDALLRQIGQAISHGLLSPAETLSPPATTSLGLDSLAPAVRVMQGEVPGLSLSTARHPDAPRNHLGQMCLENSVIDIAAWAHASPAAEQIGTFRQGLIGEFDQPDNTAILRSARGFLALGFGAEARDSLRLLVSPSEAYHQPLQSLSFLVDLEPPSANTFEHMESCDSDVALWATLALALRPKPNVFPAKAAVLRAFSALPVHLRHALGPSLVTYFLSNADTATAQALRDAMLRKATPAGGAIALMDAELELAKGETERAAQMAAPLIHETPVQAAHAAILIAESAFSGRQIVPPTLHQQLETLGIELTDDADRARLLRAKILTSAMMGDFSEAFHWASLAPEHSDDLWSLAAEAAPDDLLLSEAVKAASAGQVFPNHALAVAKRLMTYGFADAALTWLGPLATTGGTEARLLAAQAALATRDARLAYAILAGVAGDEAALLRARAAMRLGDMARALELLPASAEKEALLAAIATQDWARMAQSDLPAWREAASLSQQRLEPPAFDEGPLAQAKRLTEHSETTRRAIEKLIEATQF